MQRNMGELKALEASASKTAWIVEEWKRLCMA